MDYQEAMELLNPDTRTKKMGEIIHCAGDKPRTAIANATNEAGVLACKAIRKLQKYEEIDRECYKKTGLNVNMILEKFDIFRNELLELLHYRKMGTIEAVKNAVDKQEKKDVRIEKRYNKCRMITSYHCPTCDKFICFEGEFTSTNISKHYHFCEMCGQALNWDGVKSD